MILGRPIASVPAGQRAFTLLEILVALVVLAIALSAVVKAAAENASNAGYLRDKTLAHWVAMNAVAELRLAPAWPTPGVHRGEMRMAERTWRWSADVQPTADGSVRQVHVQVRGKTDGTVLDEVTAYLPRIEGTGQ